MKRSGPPGRRIRWPAVAPTAGWRSFQVLTVVLLGCAGLWALTHSPYRIDVDVYRLGARAWLDGQPLYTDEALFHTASGLDLPFTYPPLAAIAFCPFAWLPLPAASAAITCTTLAALIIAMAIVLAGLAVSPGPRTAPGPDWLHRTWLAAAIVAPAVVLFEPIRSNFNFGQVNAVLMALVIADCVPRRTPWPRGALLGLAVALKLTPAVFVLYFLLRRDGRAALTTVASFLVAALAGFALAARDSWQYWTDTIRNTDRIGGAALNTNQNLAGALARLALTDHQRSVLWAAGSVLVLAITLWATRRVLGAGEPVLALICVALFGLLVSPVSWSHHWVWTLPAIVVTGVLAYRRRSPALGVLSAAGAALLIWSPIRLLPENHEPTATWWRQLLGMSYVWWALAIIIAAGATVAGSRESRRQPAIAQPVSAIG